MKPKSNILCNKGETKQAVYYKFTLTCNFSFLRSSTCADVQFQTFWKIIIMQHNCIKEIFFSFETFGADWKLIYRKWMRRNQISNFTARPTFLARYHDRDQTWNDFSWQAFIEYRVQLNGFGYFNWLTITKDNDNGKIKTIGARNLKPKFGHGDGNAPKM